MCVFVLIQGVIIYCTLSIDVVTCAGKISAEHRLYNDLFADYNPNIRPVRDEKNTINVSMLFSLQHLDDLDAQKQLLRISGWLEVEWVDEYLQWNESEYGGVSRIVVPPQRVWLPSFALDNSGGEVYDLMHYNYFRVTIWSDGSVLWEPGGKFESVCVIDITYYPFDNQVCQLVFANWAYIGEQVDLAVTGDVINMERFPGNGEWHIIKTEGTRHEEIYECCPEEIFPEIHFIIYMQRKSLYYVINVLLPVLMLSLLELLIFILPCDSGEKISLGITIMLGFSVFALLIEESVPNTSEATPIIVIYLTCAMGTAALSVIASVIILAIHHHGYRSSPPSWLVRCANFSLLRHCKASKKMNGIKEVHVNGHVTNGHIPNGIANNVNKNVNHYHVNQYSSSDVNHHVNEFEMDGHNIDTYIPGGGSVVDQIHKKLQYLLDQYDDTDKKNGVSEEWKIVARSLDRTLFWIISMFLVILATIILGFIPMGKTWPTVK